MTREQYFAEGFRSIVPELPAVPEGIELYRWWWISIQCAMDGSVEIPLPREPETILEASAEAPPRYDPPLTVLIKPEVGLQGDEEQTALLGWSTEHRIAVLFYAKGGTFRPNIPKTDHPISQLTREGYRIRNEEGIRKMLEDMEREQGGSGEEWKKEQE